MQLHQSLLLDNFQIVNERYRIIRLLSRGGEGYIYLVQDLLNNNQICVMKQMYLGPDDLYGIENDYQIFGGLYHPNIVQVLDYFWNDGVFFVVMNYIAGENMKDFIRRQASPIEELKVLNWTLKLAHILRFLHDRPIPIFHADIAPENIVINNNNDLVLIDFGIARAGFEAVGLREFYSAPEQINGILDASCDVYSLGATMYKLLTLQDQPEPGADPRNDNPNISPRAAELIKRATAKSKYMFMGLIPSRYKNMDEFIEGIHRCFIGQKA
ncbi:MAG: serine/threonine-protein kinase [Candidatus Caenarcaniphilales bacterium]|nr:serine/threonine-protein kinase [Candidatus Caenarcaniphilales bacterium]